MEKRTKRKKVFITVAMTVLFILAAFLFTGCGTNNQTGQKNTGEISGAGSGKAVSEAAESSKKFEGKSLVISGSTTLLEVSNQWAEAFMAENGGEITINGGGSGVGITDLINGSNDLGNSSRKIKDEEIQQAESAGVDIKEFPVLYDGIAVIVSKNIEITELSIAQLSEIYTAKITNWSQLGGPDAGIVAIARDSASGTGEYFLERVVQLNKTVEDNDYSEMCYRLQSNADVVNQIVSGDNCIGYIGLGYLESAADNSNAVAIIAENSDKAVMASIETVKDSSYPISRELYVYANGSNISELAQAFIDYIFSEEGQDIGQQAGFVAIK